MSNYCLLHQINSSSVSASSGTPLPQKHISTGSDAAVATTDDEDASVVAHAKTTKLSLRI